MSAVQKKTRKVDISHMFNVIDSQKNGSLSSQDLRMFLGTNGVFVTERELQGLINRLNQGCNSNVVTKL